MTALRRTVAANLLIVAVVGYLVAMFLPVETTPGVPRHLAGWQLFLLGLCLFWVGFIALPASVAQGNGHDIAVAVWCLCWLANPLFWWSLVGIVNAARLGRRPRRPLVVALVACVLAVLAGVINHADRGGLLASPGYLAWAGSIGLTLLAGELMAVKEDVELPDAAALQPFHAERPSDVGAAAIQPAASRGVRAS